jgi:hypothetical protein
MRIILAILALFTITTCVITRTDVAPVDISGSQPITVSSPVNVHLNDGSSVHFEDGLTVSENTVFGSGVVFDERNQVVQEISELPFEDVVAMESVQETTNVPATAAASIAVGAIAFIGAALVAVALFGSCPTVYSLAADVPILEAELFSYSIAPAFQSRDVDRLGISSLIDGSVVLEIRNEMLETHYIDQLELIETTHTATEKVYPGRKGEPIVASEFVDPVSAIDQDSRDILPSIQHRHNYAWSASDERLARVNETDYLDHLYLEFDLPAGADDPAVILRMRNSMLNTVLFYDIMMKGQGFGALDWFGKDLSRFTSSVKTGLWYRENMGLQIDVWNNGRYRSVGRIADQGPIAWSERALQLPDVKPEDGKLKLRLSFVADNWRIDHVSLALKSKVPRSRLIAVETATTEDGLRTDIPAKLARADKEYLITRPGESVQVQFNVGVNEDNLTRTFFLASDGYYIEWMRSDWLTQEQVSPFKPGNQALISALNLYAKKRDGYRELFESTKINVR